MSPISDASLWRVSLPWRETLAILAALSERCSPYAVCGVDHPPASAKERIDVCGIVEQDRHLVLVGVDMGALARDGNGPNGNSWLIVGESIVSSSFALDEPVVRHVPPRQDFRLSVEPWGPMRAGTVFFYGWRLSDEEYRHVVQK